MAGADDQRRSTTSTGGRNFETLGEDPFLAGQLRRRRGPAASRAQGLIAELKHYIENDFENGRTSTSVKIDDQTLHETELQAFEAGVDAGAGSVMCSYNRINDVYGCAQRSHTLHGILKGELGFNGFVTSDWGATHQHDRPHARTRHGAAGQRRRHQQLRGRRCWPRCRTAPPRCPRPTTSRP